MRLVSEEIVKMKYSKENNKQDIHWDDEVRGFGVRIYPNQKKNYVIGYHIHRRRKLTTFAKVEDMYVEEAREEARRLLDEIKDTHRQPTKEVKNLTVEQLCKIYIERHAMKMKTYKEEIQRIETHISSRWGKSKVEAVTLYDLKQMHSEITKRGPVEANRMIQIYRRIINFGKKTSLLSPTFQNLASDVVQHVERPRDRWVNPEEMPRLLKAINNVENVYVRAAFWLYLLTGVRKMELLKLRHCDFDRYQRTLRLVDTKNSRDRYVQLSDTAFDILTKLPPKPNNPYIFPGLKQGQHLKYIYNSWQKVRAEAGMDDLTIHDLRRTCGSMLAQRGCSLVLIAEILGHRDLSSVEIYTRFNQDHVKKALSDHSDVLVNENSIDPKTEYMRFILNVC